MKKILSTMAVLAAVLWGASAEVKFSFYNKLYEEDPFIQHYEKGKDGTSEPETVKDFMGVANRMYFEVFTDRVDAMIKADFKLDDNTDTNHLYLAGRVKDWSLEFRPIEMISLNLHTGIFADGSYLPIYDDNVNAANIGSDGFTVTVRPVKGLRLAASAPFGMGQDTWSDKNYLNGDKDKGEANPFDVRLGAIYEQELFQIGLAAHDIADSDERQFGSYVNLPTLFGLSDAVTIGAGFAHSESIRSVVPDHDTISLGHIEGDVYYKNLLNAYAVVELEKFAVSAEAAYNFSDDNTQAVYDLYSAASLSFSLTDNLTAGIVGKLLSDIKSEATKNENILLGGIGLEYDANENHTLGIEFDVAKQDKDWSLAVPLFWKYHIDN